MNEQYEALRRSPGEHRMVKQALGEATLRATSAQLGSLDWLWDHLSPEGKAKLLLGQPHSFSLEVLEDG